MGINVDEQKKRLEALEMEKFKNGDPDPIWPIDYEKILMDAYYAAFSDKSKEQ